MQPVRRNDYYPKYSQPTRPELRSVRPLNPAGGGETLRWKPVLTETSPPHTATLAMTNNVARLSHHAMQLHVDTTIDDDTAYATGQVDVFRLVVAIFGLSLYVGIPAAGLVYVGLKIVG